MVLAVKEGTEKGSQKGFLDLRNEKAHKHKSFWPVAPGESSGRVSRRIYGLSSEPRNINLLARVPDRPGPLSTPVNGGRDRKPFLLPRSGFPEGVQNAPSESTTP